MTPRKSMVGGVLAAILLAAVLLGSGAAAGNAAVVTPTPTPTPTKLTVSVVIPDLNPSPSPSPSRSRESEGGGSGGGTKGEDGGLKTESFGKPTPPSSPTSGAGKLTLDHETITAKEWMTATGNGFTPGENVQFVYYPGAVVIGSFVADGKGKVVARFQIPDDLRSGAHTIEATGWTSKRILNSEFTVTTQAAGAFPYLWWVWVVLGVLVLGLLALAIYFRRSIAEWFGGAQATGAAS